MPRIKQSSHGTPTRKRNRTKRPAPALPTPTAPVVSKREHGALAAFFNRYKVHDFVYNPTAVPPLECQRLKEHLGIRRADDPRSKPTQDAFRQAMAAEFGIKFGRNMNDLAGWQKLCKRIGINPLPATLTRAREEFKRTHVNIVQLMTTGIPDGGMPKFATERGLACYTRSKHWLTFPRKSVEDGGLLWHLLRRIWHPLYNPGIGYKGPVRRRGKKSGSRDGTKLHWFTE